MSRRDNDTPLTVLLDLLFYTGNKGGIETYVRELYRELGRLDEDVRYVALASTEAFEESGDWFPGEFVNAGISGHIRGWNRVRWSWAELQRVPRWARQVGADVIHCPAMLGPRRSSIPTVVTVHDLLYWTHPEHMPSQIMLKPGQWMLRAAATGATRIITDSRASANDIVHYLGIPQERLDVIMLAGTIRDGASIHRTATPDRTILATGNRLGHKNYASLIRALPLIPGEVRPKLIITGSKGDDPLRAVVAETAMQDWVDLRGWVTEVELDELYSTVAALAIPSLHEGSCLPGLEAMLVGLPVMLSDIPTFREIVADAGIYFDPLDLQSIADAMIIVATDPDRLHRAAVDGRTQAATFSWQQTATETLASLRSAVAPS